MAEARTAGRLGIIAGGGQMPRLVADAAVAGGRAVVILAMSGFFDGNAGPHPLVLMSPGQVSALFGALRRYNCREVLMVGEMRRPRLRDLQVDFGIIRQLPLLFGVKGQGDDGAMQRLTQVFESQGFQVVSLRDVAASLAAPLGLIGRKCPSEKAALSISFAFDLLAALSPFDVGQAVIIHRRRVLALEGAEGTNQMIARIGDLRRNGRFAVAPPSGILVKMPKISQELRNDMPVIGELTLEAARDAGLEGIAVAAGGVAMSDCGALSRCADEAGLFLVGCDRDGRWAPA